MSKKVIKCSFGQRIFDVYAGSKVNIEIKCKKDNCKCKSKCSKREVMKIGFWDSTLKYVYNPFYCSQCGQRLFDASVDSLGRVEIKCLKCRSIEDIVIGDVNKTAFAA